MRRFIHKGILILLLVMSATAVTSAQKKSIDEFENKEGWSFIKSDGVSLDLSVEKGFSGNAIRFDYDFKMGTGYGGIQKRFPIDLPENYEFSFYIKASSPSNNFEIKFIDSTGNNVWWVNNRNYDFPAEWTRIRIKKRDISFAWGPVADQTLKRVDRIEFTVASFVGGNGTVQIDNLKFEPLPPETNSWPAPSVTASSSMKGHSPEFITDSSDNTYWINRKAKGQQVTVDFRAKREFGGLLIKWLKDHHAKSFDILLSEDGRNWEKVYSVQSNRSEISFIRLPEAEAAYLRINLITPGNEKNFGIAEVEITDLQSTKTPNDFFRYAAARSPAGNYPRYFSEQASYWTVTGVNNDVREALINEDGTVEVDKGLFSIEPMLRVGDSLYNWSNVKPIQSMGFPEGGGEFAFLPSVTWLCDDLKFVTGVSSGGSANIDSRLNIGYSLTNLSDQPGDLELYLLIRPFQVNPYYQFLNTVGGAGKINSIREEGATLIAVDEKVILSTRKYDSFGAAVFDEGNIVDFIREKSMPLDKAAVDPSGSANGVIKYSIRLNGGEQTEFFVTVPFYGKGTVDKMPDVNKVSDEFYGAADYLEDKG